MHVKMLIKIAAPVHTYKNNRSDTVRFYNDEFMDIRPWNYWKHLKIKLMYIRIHAHPCFPFQIGTKVDE